MWFLNLMTPLIADDYLSAFALPARFSMSDILQEELKRLDGFQDFFNNIISYYMGWGGRVPGGIPVGIFVLIGKEYFNPVNAFMFILLIMEIYWISHEGKITLGFDSSYLVWIFFVLWTFNIVFFDTPAPFNNLSYTLCFSWKGNTTHATSAPSAPTHHKPKK